MHRVGPFVFGRRGHEEGRVAHPVPNPMIRRIREERAKVAGILRVAVFGDAASAKDRITDHVGERLSAKDRAEQVGALRRRGGYEQPAVRRSFDGEPLGSRVPAGDEGLGRRDEIIEDVLLLVQHPARCQGSPYSSPPRRQTSA